MKRTESVMVMQTRDRMSWFVIPWSVLGAGFAIVWFIAVFIVVLTGGNTPVYTGAVATFYFLMLVVGIGAVTRMFPFAVSFTMRRRDYLMGTLALGVAVCAAWAILLGLLSLIEANVIKNWGLGLHFFHLPFFSDGSLLRQFCWSYYRDMACARSDPSYLRDGWALGQFWVYFVLLLFMWVLGLLLGSIYQRFGRVGEYVFAGIVLLLVSLCVVLSSYRGWWGPIFDWLAQQTAGVLALWLVPLIAICAFACYALLRKATV